MSARRTAALLSAVALTTAAAAAPAAAVADQQVSVQFDRFAPSAIDALPGEQVHWSNVSPRTHTVTGLAFASGELAPGASFSWPAAAPGVYPYHCTIHPEMVGEIDVRRVTLDPLPPAAVVAGAHVDIAGRTADPLTPVRIERDRGTGFGQVAVVTPAANGDWHATVTATATADYRALSGPDASEVRRLLVSNRHVTIRAVRGGVSVSVSPSDPTGRLLLEQKLREHFGWWPVARKRLDFVSEARFRVHRRALTRVVLVDRDGWTPIAVSRSVRARP